jgi:hypothetical protein
MKKYVFGLMFFIFASGLFAQDSKVSGGLYISPILSWLKPDSKTIEKDGSRFGFGFGIPVDFNFSKNFALSTGVSFENLGGSLKYLDTIPKFETVDSNYVNLPKNSVIKYKTQYIEIPISLKGKTNEIGYITYFIKAGISPCFRFKAKGDVTVNSGDDIKAEVRAFEMGYHISGGIEYSLGGNTKLLVEAIFTNGLTNFSKVETKDKTGTLKNNKVIQNSIGLRVGILF